MSLLCEATGEKIWKESLDGAKHQDVTNRRQWDQQDNNKRDEREEVLGRASGRDEHESKGKTAIDAISHFSQPITYRKFLTSRGFNV